MPEPAPKPAFLIHALYRLDPSDVVAFKSIAARMAADTIGEPGCIFLHAAQDVSAPAAFHLIEAWRSLEEFEAFGGSAKFQGHLQAAMQLRIVDRSASSLWMSSTGASICFRSSVRSVSEKTDQVVPYAASAPLAVKLLRNGVLKTYKGLPHGCMTTHPDLINADILAFVRGEPATSAHDREAQLTAA